MLPDANYLPSTGEVLDHPLPKQHYQEQQPQQPPQGRPPGQLQQPPQGRPPGQVQQPPQSRPPGMPVQQPPQGRPPGMPVQQPPQGRPPGMPVQQPPQQPQQPPQQPQQPLQQPQQPSGAYCPTSKIYPPQQQQPYKMIKNLAQVQHPDLIQFIKSHVEENKFNKYCVDCMQQKTSYLVAQYGIFICESCAYHHKLNFPVQKHYLKEIYTELFDPWQIKVLQYSDNQQWFEVVKEYKLEKETYLVKYKHPVAKWYRKQFQAKCAGLHCFEKKPPVQQQASTKVTNSLASLFK